MIYNYPFVGFPHIRRYSSYPSHYSGYSTMNNASSNENMNNLEPAPVFSRSRPYSQRGNVPLPKTKESYAENSPINSAPQKNHTERPSSARNINILSNLFHQEDREGEKPLFEIFGLKLYYDDVLLVGLIYFLYQEQVKDQYLFIALILLLLS